MLTPQEVSTRAFAKAMMGGYNMAAVDEFLDELTDDYTALYKENATLKAKLKVLVEKVEEYRATEDSMRATLLTAQKMADSIVHEAEQKRDQMLREAKTAAQTRISDSERELEEAEARLRRGQEDLARFIIASQELCQRQLEFLEQLPHVEVSTPSALEQEAARQVKEAVQSVFPAETLPQSAEPVTETPPEPPAPPAPPVKEEKTVLEIPPADPPLGGPGEPTRRINLEELKFGRNYSSTQE